MTPSQRIPAGRVGILVSRYNETVTERLLAGAEACLRERGVPRARVDVLLGCRCDRDIAAPPVRAMERVRVRSASKTSHH